MFSSFLGGGGGSSKKANQPKPGSEAARMAEASAKAKKLISEERGRIKGPMEQVNSRQSNNALRYGCMGGVGLSGAVVSYLAAQRLPALGSFGALASLGAAMYGGPYLHNTYVEVAKMEAAKTIDSSLEKLETADGETGQLIPEYYEEIEVLRRMRSEIAPEGSSIDLAVKGVSKDSAMEGFAEQLAEMGHDAEHPPQLSQSEIIDLQVKKIVGEYETKRAQKKAFAAANKEQ